MGATDVLKEKFFWILLAGFEEISYICRQKSMEAAFCAALLSVLMNYKF